MASFFTRHAALKRGRDNLCFKFCLETNFVVSQQKGNQTLKGNYSRIKLIIFRNKNTKREEEILFGG